MKIKTTWLLVALTTFVIGVVAVSAGFYLPKLRARNQSKSNAASNSSTAPAAPEIPTVAFCDLVRNPQQYDQKIIRTKAILTVGIDTQTLWSDECDNDKFRVRGECFHPPEKDCEKVFTEIDNFRGGEKVGWLSDSTEVDLVGQFFADKDNQEMRLEMLNVKGAKALNRRFR